MQKCKRRTIPILMLLVLMAVELFAQPDLKIETTDINFSNDIPYLNEVITISATIHNMLKRPQI